jgi:hypothetical protein
MVSAKAVLPAMRALRAIYGEHGVRQAADTVTDRYVCRRDRFILTTIPKVGTKSFKHLFMSDQRFAGCVELHQGKLNENYTGEDGYFHFSFVRNPWDRTVSCYKDKVLRSETIGNLSILSRYNSLRPQMPFDEFVEWLSFSPEGADHCADRHWVSQHLFLTGCDGNISCDFIGKLENIDQDIQIVADRLGLGKMVLPLRHQSKDAESQRYYNSRLRNLIGERYATDIELFDYA